MSNKTRMMEKQQKERKSEKYNARDREHVLATWKAMGVLLCCVLITKSVILESQ